MNAAVDSVPARPAGRALAWAIGIAILVRLATLGLYPLSDATESRYAEIARKMLVLGDWVTPWYDDAMPFWGKPPLSTWLTAASMRVFGINEWAARMPHFLAGLLVSWLLWDWARRRSEREALPALAVLWGCALYFVSAGAVMTDMALLVGMMLAMRGFWVGMHASGARETRERWLLFVGLAIGLLAKGPIAVVLAGLPAGLWVLSTGNLRQAWRRLPWVRGTALTLALALPWYVLAERHTPGFLDYFLIGEHWHRFTVPGWSGDQYGSAHVAPRGMVWVYLLAACLPWSVLIPVLAFGRRRHAVSAPAERDWLRYLLLWALAPCVFFTVSRNILWTYVLPGLPALALLGAGWLACDQRQARTQRVLAFGLVLACGLFAGFIGVQRATDGFRSAKAVVAAFEARSRAGDQLIFVGRNQHSASFYTKGKAQRLARIEDLGATLRDERARPADGASRFVALHDRQWEALAPDAREHLKPQGRFGGYQLYVAR